MRYSWIVLFVLMVFYQPVSAFEIEEAEQRPQQIVLWNQNFTEGYSVEFITLIAELSKDKFGPYTLTSSPELEQGRAIKELLKGEHLNIAIMGNEAERERINPPIYFPVNRGALGLRVCFIKKGQQARFDGIRSAADARTSNLVFGSGTYWPDKAILEANGFSVLSSPVFANLFVSLRKDRFDCLTRGVSEVS